jgi:ubiquinol-cytochrome c reductase cytochrome c subunit
MKRLARRIAVVAALAALLAVVPAAAYYPPIVRPVDEEGLTPLELGKQLYGGNCSSCHGNNGQGVSTQQPQAAASNIKVGAGPPLVAAGALAADFYLRTGYMPLAEPDKQPVRQRSPFNEREIHALTTYVASLGNGPPIPHPKPEQGSTSRGLILFTQHCAGCHQVAAAGGVVTGARVPPLNLVNARQIAQAVRVGPYVMPKFSQKAISDSDLNSIIRYVLYAQHPHDPGGWGLNHLGPFPEGMVAWGIAGIVLILLCGVIGTRLGRE